MFDHYCQEKVDGVRGWDLLGIDSNNYSKFKRESLPLKHVKTICSELGIPLTDDEKTLAHAIVERL